MKVPGLLEIERRRQGLTGTELAEKMRVARTLLSEVELGHRNPSPAFQQKAASALDVEVGALFPRFWLLIVDGDDGISVVARDGHPVTYSSEDSAVERAGADGRLRVCGPVGLDFLAALLGVSESRAADRLLLANSQPDERRP